ncbi:MAG TPA: hypothetical protein VMG34_08245 [Bacteroidota bacterium]|nr:hypothetical protein [Bacteroidota bacterium]
MDDPEQYLMQVLHRTRTGLQDSLIPFHAAKMGQLAEKLEGAVNLPDELGRLQRVNGFTKAALSMEWVMRRVSASGEDFSPDQFDADATLISDKLFEAFLSEPFDAPSEPPQPDQPAVAEAPLAEVFSPEQPVPSAENDGAAADIPAEEPVQEVHQEAPILAEEPPSPPPPAEPEPPALSDLLDQNLLLGFQRFTEIVSKLEEKAPSERKSVFAVLGMIAKSSTDVARAQSKKDVLEFFQSVSKFIAFVDSSGSTQDPKVASLMREAGERLSKALKERSNGAEVLHGVTEMLRNPEATLKT